MERYSFPKLMAVMFLFVTNFDLANADNDACRSKLLLQDYEPNTVYIRKDNNDIANIDFTISQMVPIWHNGCGGDESTHPDWFVYPYFAFTGEFGFYALGGRDSSPVIGKRFNPKLFVRKWLDSDDEYIDFGYAHESNGQTINTEEAYLNKISELESKGERSEFANDYLSRGWDYLNIVYKHKMKSPNLLKENYLYLDLKYFLKDGIFQGTPEEYYEWETNDGKARDEVDGISIMLKTRKLSLGTSGNSQSEVHGFKVYLKYTTGYTNIFENNTVRAELTYLVKGWLPLSIWASHGYNSSLTDYYKNVTSYGIGIELRNFLSKI